MMNNAGKSKKRFPEVTFLKVLVAYGDDRYRHKNERWCQDNQYRVEAKNSSQMTTELLQQIKTDANQATDHDPLAVRNCTVRTQQECQRHQGHGQEGG